MFTRLRTPGNSNKATVRKFIGGGTLNSKLYWTKSCKGHPPIRLTDEWLPSERRTQRHFVGNPRNDAEFKCLIAPSAKGPFKVYSILPRLVILLTI